MWTEFGDLTLVTLIELGSIGHVVAVLIRYASSILHLLSHFLQKVGWLVQRLELSMAEHRLLSALIIEDQIIYVTRESGWFLQILYSSLIDIICSSCFIFKVVSCHLASFICRHGPLLDISLVLLAEALVDGDVLVRLHALALALDPLNTLRAVWKLISGLRTNRLFNIDYII